MSAFANYRHGAIPSFADRDQNYDIDQLLLAKKSRLEDTDFIRDNMLSDDDEVAPERGSSVTVHDSPLVSLRTLLFGALAAMLLAVAVVFVIIKTRRRKAGSPLELPSKQPSLVYPSLVVDVRSVPQQQQQLPVPYLHLSGQSSDASTFRKPKGLLERRGSNASLTIEVNSCDKLACASDRECSTEEEMLLSAGNKLARQQLRESIKDKAALRREFLEIPLNYTAKLDITGAASKNRYRSIFPNAQSRVVLPELPDEPGSSYINANYVRGYDAEPKTYIATQGPLPNTIVDFWRMVWFENASAIVMLTKLNEKNKVKCEQYLPTKSDTYGLIHVTVERITSKDGYYVRDLTVKNTATAEKRYLRHYWFKSWPDHKAPVSTAKHLLDLSLELDSERRRRLQNLECLGPTVVHCSAGIGRTGCFIATSIAMKQLQEENAVDLLGIVCQMRVDRGGMLTSPEQYQFLHHAIVLYEKQLSSASPSAKNSPSTPPPSSTSTSSTSAAAVDK